MYGLLAGSSLQNKCSVWVDHRFTSVVFVGVGVVVAMILSLDIGDVLFSGKIIFALLAASYLVAPLLERHLKFK